jgi:hypothetical protein
VVDPIRLENEVSSTTGIVMTIEERTSYPLSWPDGWARTKYREQSRFTRAYQYTARNHSMSEARTFLADELRRLGATKEILSTNVELRLDGTPYSNRAQPTDPGAAVYFQFQHKPIVLACDKWLRVEDNVWALAKHIESLRGQERWGVGRLEQAFRGYMALPGIGQTSGINWWQTLGVPVNASEELVRDAYKMLVKKHHPDLGGDPELFRRLQEAMDQFERSKQLVTA